MIRSFTPFKPYHYAFSAGGGITAKVLVLDVQSIQVTFSQCVDITAAWGIEVSIAGGDWEIVPSVSGGINKVWTFTTTTEIADDDVVLWQYTGAEDSIVDCVIGNDVGAIGPVTATNPIDLTAPTLVSAEIGTVFDESSDVLVLTFSEPVYSTHPTNGWTLLEGANELTITSASGAGTDTLHFTVTETIYQGQTIIVSYDDEVGDLADVSGYPDGNALASITDEAVTNNSETPIPILWSRDFTTLDLGDGDTFGRVSVGYHQQPSGAWEPGLSGEARMYGARRIGNLWGAGTFADHVTDLAVGVTATGDQVDYIADDARIAKRSTAGAFALGQVVRMTIELLPGGTATSGIVGIRLVDSPSRNHYADGLKFTTVDLAMLPQTISISATLSGTPLPCVMLEQRTSVIPGVTNTLRGTLNIGRVQFEVVSAVADPPSELQASGAAVSYYKTEKGNSVSGTGVVTYATGAALPGPFGLLMEPLETNLVASSETADYVGLTTTTAVASVISGVNLSGFITIASSGVHQAFKSAFAPGGENVPYWARAILKTNGSYNVGFIIVHDGLNSDNARRTVVFFNATTGAYLSSLGVAPLATKSVVQADGSILFAVRVDTLTTSNRAIGIGILPTAQDPIVAWTPDGTSGFYVGNISLTTTEPGSFIVTSGAAASRAIDTLDYTDDELNNEARIVKRLVSDPGTDVIVDIDDWDYTVPAPTVPQFIQRIDVYAPGGRPA